MATTYDYQTGKIERDFKFVRYGEKCKRSGLPCYAGATNRCEKCKLFAPTQEDEYEPLFDIEYGLGIDH